MSKIYSKEFETYLRYDSTDQLMDSVNKYINSIRKNKIFYYKEQLDNVRNNREYDHLSKEIEFETLEIELSEKRIKEFTQNVKNLKEQIETSHTFLTDRSADLAQKKEELDEIVSETKQQEEVLREEIKGIEAEVEPRLLQAFKRIRKSARNGLAIVSIERGACGGCFNKIPPQKQMDIKLGKKILVCEYCGRIMVDTELINNVGFLPLDL